MYQLKIESAAGMKTSAFIHPDIVNKIGLRLGSRTSFPRDQLLTEFGYPAGVGAKTENNFNLLYEFINAVLRESRSEYFVVQIEPVPVKPKLNPIFNSIETLPEEDRQLIVVFSDKEIMSGVEYCKGHDELHTRKGDLKKHLIHQWAYADEFYAQLNLPEFPKEQPKHSGLDEAIPELFKLLFAAAAMAEKASDQEKKKGFKFH